MHGIKYRRSDPREMEMVHHSPMHFEDRGPVQEYTSYVKPLKGIWGRKRNCCEPVQELSSTSNVARGTTVSRLQEILFSKHSNRDFLERSMKQITCSERLPGLTFLYLLGTLDLGSPWGRCNRNELFLKCTRSRRGLCRNK